MPSVLVELGFISTPAEEKYLVSEEGSTSMANSIFNAFLAYKTEQQAREASVNNTSASSVKADNEDVKPIANVKPTPAKTEPSKAETKKTETKKAESKKDTTKEQPKKATAASGDAPVFKIQFLTSSTKLANNDKRLKGLQPVEYYVENGTYKYTYGASTNYNTVKSKLKTVTTKFKDAFIIAFKNDNKVNVNDAIKEFMQNKK